VSHPSAVSGAFGQPFTQQIAFFRAKLGNLVPTQRWDDMQAQAHDTGFMVAGAAKADLLTDLAAAVDKALSEGRGIEEFRRDFQSIVARNGWTGWTGEGSIQGEAWRVKTILRTNAYTSYSAGRHTQLLDGNFAFWVYRHGDSREPRPEHLALDGIALPPSHLFWMKFYPPSDWGCSCYALGARTAASVRRLGGNPSKTLPANWDAIDLKTGEPAGIGKGWGYAPGASVARRCRLWRPRSAVGIIGWRKPSWRTFRRRSATHWRRPIAHCRARPTTCAAMSRRSSRIVRPSTRHRARWAC
jgi:hypothetical protein